MTSSRIKSAPFERHSLQPGQEALRHDKAHVGCDRLDDHRGNLPRVRSKSAVTVSRSLYAATSVSARSLYGHTRRVRQAERSNAAAGLDEQHIHVAVVAAGELHDLVPPGVGPRQSQRGHRRFGAAVDEADHLDGGHEADHQFGKLALQGGRSAVARAAVSRLLQRLDDRRVRVAQRQRPHERT
jgi:hypothetical protein